MLGCDHSPFWSGVFPSKTSDLRPLISKRRTPETFPWSRTDGGSHVMQLTPSSTISCLWTTTIPSIVIVSLKQIWGFWKLPGTGGQWTEYSETASYQFSELLTDYSLTTLLGFIVIRNEQHIPVINFDKFEWWPNDRSGFCLWEHQNNITPKTTGGRQSGQGGQNHRLPVNIYYIIVVIS